MSIKFLKYYIRTYIMFYFILYQTSNANSNEIPMDYAILIRDVVQEWVHLKVCKPDSCLEITSLEFIMSHWPLCSVSVVSVLSFLVMAFIPELISNHLITGSIVQKDFYCLVSFGGINRKFVITLDCRIWEYTFFASKCVDLTQTSKKNLIPNNFAYTLFPNYGTKLHWVIR